MVSHTFQLFVAGISTDSDQLHEELKALLLKKGHLNYTIEIIDVFLNSDRAYQEKVMATPTLVRAAPLPIKKIILDSSSERKLELALDLILSRDES